MLWDGEPERRRSSVEPTRRSQLRSRQAQDVQESPIGDDRYAFDGCKGSETRAWGPEPPG